MKFKLALRIWGILILIGFTTGCKHDVHLVRKPGICLSFDDRAVQEWYSLDTLLKEHHARSTFFVTKFHKLSVSEIIKLKALEKSGNEIGSHGTNHVNAEYYIKANSYRSFIDSEVLSNNNLMKAAGLSPTAFAYPYGAKYWFTDLLLLKYFKILRSVAPLNPQKDLTQIEDIYYKFDGDRSLSSIGIDYDVSLEMLDKAMKRCRRNNEVLMLHGHFPYRKNDLNTYQNYYKQVESIIELANKNKLTFYTISELSN